MDIDTAAPVITREKIGLNAPIETIWGIQTATHQRRSRR